MISYIQSHTRRPESRYGLLTQLPGERVGLLKIGVVRIKDDGLYADRASAKLNWNA